MRWSDSPQHRGDQVKEFLSERFSDESRRVLLIAGAGFDPRAQLIPVLLHDVLGERLRTLLLKEERPSASTDLIARAEANQQALTDVLQDYEVAAIDVLSEDLSVVGGRKATRRVAQEFSDGFTDIVIDMSALSLGVGFPVVRCVLERADTPGENSDVHVVLAGHSTVDHIVHAIPLEQSKEVFGFKGNYGIESTSNAAKLWLPQLAYDQRAALGRIYDSLRPHDVCPILPFPSIDPRSGDCLLDHYSAEILDTWDVAPKNVIYAAEGNPLDLYRTILRIDDERAAVFEEVGGSQLLLTPTGSKALALGALMAAVERDLPVHYVESMGYTVDWEKVDRAPENGVNLLHLWLAGEPYSSNNGAGTG